MTPMEQGTETLAEFTTSGERDAAFEQLLRLAASYASAQRPGTQNQPPKTPKRGRLIEDIQLRAYHIYLGRGATNGHDLDDWLQAERQVLEDLKKTKASLRLALAFGHLKDSKK